MGPPREPKRLKRGIGSGAAAPQSQDAVVAGVDRST